MVRDKYLYPNTDVLINKFNIKDSKKLDKVEYTYVSLNITYIIDNPIKINSVFDICIIHKILFKDIYEWAGTFRNLNIYKEEPILTGLSVKYSEYKNINRDLNSLDKRFKSTKWNELSHEDTIDEVILIISKLWKIHCFREGNTRAVTTFLYLLMKQINLKVNVLFISNHAKFFRNALVMASIDEYSEFEHLKNILLDSVSMKETNENKYKTIREYEVEKYQYRNHKYKE
ncbi:MAG: Fic family protein [Candidatus Caccosoma sp.]|nr:Fic family protein [Candidatus Caccosoma sp.]